MTRIFEALRKARNGGRTSPARESAATPSPPEQLLRGATASATSRALRAAPNPRAPEPFTGGGETSPLIVPIRTAIDLSEEIVREMTRLRVNIEAQLVDRPIRSVLFVSAQGQEGTSTLAYQFAFTLARDSRLRPLYVDAHARRPSLGGAPVAPGAGGSSDFPRIAGPGRHAPASSDDAESGALEAWPLGDQFREAGILSPAIAREVIEWGSNAYDWIVFDGPPILESPDAAPMGAVVDGVVVVVEAGRTKRPVLQSAVDLLRKAGGHVMGIVLNRRRLEIPEFIYRRI